MTIATDGKMQKSWTRRLNLIAIIGTLPMILVAVGVFVIGVGFSVLWSFTSSKLFPSYDFVGLAQYRRLWSDGRWNKLTLAHGCYWKKCNFCDVTLDYIGRYDAASADLLVDRIESIVRDLGHELTGVAVTRDEAVALAMEDRPGLVLADIQLADDSSGIDAVKDILAEFNVPVIFITAFPERLLTGERPEPTFLITKPFQRSTVKAAISQALFFDQSTVPA